MCGICGILDCKGRSPAPDILESMVSSLAHRGPDGDGRWIEQGVALGHRRLAILDLSSAGAQPMSSTDGRYHIVYNGEVYNYPDLKQELESLGCVFRSRSDTEAILHAYILWGASCVERLDGMFALVIWDRVAKTLFLARDRFGVKPLYYAWADGCLLFASEWKALLCHPALERQVDVGALVEYFTFQNIFSDRTFFRDIKLFAPGTWALAYQDEPGRLDATRYWDFQFVEPEHPRSAEDYEEELDFLFQRAVSRQMLSDVEVSSYLSGGLDSSAITAVATRKVPYIKTFTCGFDLSSASGLELNFDEREQAEYLSYLLKTEHYEVVLKSGDMERCLPALVRHLEEPRLGQSYPIYYISRLASRFAKVTLAGTGGDELFGGYPWRYYRVAVNSSFESYVDKYYLYWQRLLPNREIKRVFAPVGEAAGRVWTRDIFLDVLARQDMSLKSPEDYVNASLTFEARTFLRGLLLVEDKLSMAHGMETRVPFLDNDLVDFAQRVPVGLKLGNLREVARIDENDPLKLQKFFDRTRDGKLILRRVMGRHVPQEVCSRAKQGFSGPDASWFKGDSITYVKNVIYRGRSPMYAFLDRRRIQELVMEHLEGKVNRRLLVWSLLYFDEWCKQHL